MLARDNVLVGDDQAKVTFEREGIYTDHTTGKPVAATTRYTYQDGEIRYVVSFTRTHDLSVSRMVDTIKGGQTNRRQASALRRRLPAIRR
jgi:hypothetical protein